jgi:hypothetical protein
MLAIDGRDFYGLEVGRQDDLKHFDVFAVSKLAMTNLRWLMHTRPCFDPNWALTFTFANSIQPSSTDQLKARVVKVWLT